ncbi:TPA: aldose 1-epimerase [Candidatus Poribacteria bacterium]|nr:aldose 1-epimerase [Candidatus Poribacteria bacterium]
MLYSVETEIDDGFDVLILKDPSFGSEARVAPEIGANCFKFTITHEGKTFDIIDPPPSLTQLRESPSGYGNPVLFPFPNRIRNGTFTFDGQTYQFDKRPGWEHSIHGLVYTRTWEVSDRGTQNSAYVKLRFDSKRYPDVMRQYPFPFIAELTYSLKGWELTVDFSVQNTGVKRMPMGYGLHPYFRAPISPETPPERCFIRIPARKLWELKDFLPTGMTIPVDERRDFRTPRPLAGVMLDDVYTDLIYEDGLVRCFIDDKGMKLKTVVEAERAFREIVAYTPPRGGAICFEPYTCPTDAPNLASKGLDVGLILLEPGESFKGTVRFAVESYE